MQVHLEGNQLSRNLIEWKVLGLTVKHQIVVRYKCLIKVMTTLALDLGLDSS